MKNIADYFRLPEKSSAVSSQLDSANHVYENQAAKKPRKLARGKRKQLASSDSDADVKNTSAVKNRKRKLSSKVDNDQKFSVNRNARVRVKRVDSQINGHPLKSESSPEGFHLVSVELKDCFSHIDFDQLDEKQCRLDDCDDSSVDRRSSNRKRKPVVKYDSKKSNDSDSSDSVFVEPSKPPKNSPNKIKKVDKTSKGSPSENRSLLKYFRMEKPNSMEKNSPTKSKLTEDSPVKPSKICNVVAVVHSPPKSPTTRASYLKNMNEIKHPVVKLVRTNVPVFNLDQITVESTEIQVDKSSVSRMNGRSELKEDVNSNSPSPRANGTPWRMRVRFARSGESPLESPKKKEKKEQVSRKANSRKKTDSVDISLESNDADVDSADEVQVIATTKNKRKLAPLFCKKNESKEEKRVVEYSPVVEISRRLFLESGVPESVKKKMKTQKSNVDENSSPSNYAFPKVSHVQQKDANCFVWTLSNVFDLQMKPPDDVIVEFENELFSGFVDLDRVSLDSRVCDESKFDVKQELDDLTKTEPNIDVNSTYLNAKKWKNLIENEGNACWTEKYKPASYSDMIGNAVNLTRLKEWIEIHKNLKFKSTETEDTSSEEFIDSDDSSGGNRIRNTIAILVGPPGCGKTCAVYTLANELGYNVLELNTTSNRNGKRVLDELLEATQSHRVKRTNIFTNEAIKKAKKKKKDAREEKKMSLILVEDADVLFENHDEGFTSALNTLTAESKRPMIFTLNDINRPHLSRYNNSHNLILRFTYPSRSSLNVWLKSIALNEGVKLTDNALMQLFQVAGCDFRKNLLQLQLMISSKKTFKKLDQEQLFYVKWWEQVNRVKRTERKPTECSKQAKSVFSEDEESEIDDSLSDEMKNAAQSVRKEPKDSEELEMMNTSRSVKNERDLEALEQCSNFSRKISQLENLKAGLMNDREEFFETDGSVMHDSIDVHAANINEEIGDFVRKRIFESLQFADSQFSFEKYHDKFREVAEIRILCENVFNDFKPPCMEGSSRYCDYLPTIREMARIERDKIAGNAFVRKRSRYFSYLKSVNIHLNDRETEFLCNSLVS